MDRFIKLVSVNTKKRNPVSWAMMELTHEQDEEIKPPLPGQRGKVKLSNRKLLNRIWSVAEQGCQWRGLPSRFGNWPPIYRRMNRGAKTGVLNGRFEAWPAKKIIPVRIEGYSLDKQIRESAC